MTDVFPAPPAVRVPVRGGGTFPVRRIFCVGRNFADHAKEMGAAPGDPVVIRRLQALLSEFSTA